MKPQRIATAVAAMAGVVSAFLPWMRVTGDAWFAFPHPHGWLALGTFGVAAMYAFAGDTTQALRGGGRVLVMALGVVTAGYAVLRIVEIDMLQAALIDHGGHGDDVIRPDIGLFVMIAAGVLLVLAGIKPGAAPPPPIPRATVVGD